MKHFTLWMAALATVVASCGEAAPPASPLAKFTGTWTMKYGMQVVRYSGGVYSSGYEEGTDVVQLQPSNGTLSYDVKVVKAGEVTDHWTVSLKEVAGSTDKVTLTMVLHGSKKDYTIVDALPLTWSPSSGFSASDSEPAADGKKMKGSITFGDGASHKWSIPTGGSMGDHTVTFTRK